MSFSIYKLSCTFVAFNVQSSLCMTEKELQQYLLARYPMENEACEWKEFENSEQELELLSSSKLEDRGFQEITVLSTFNLSYYPYLL